MGARPGHDAQGCWARHDQLTNATLAASFGIGFSDDRGPVVLIVLVVLVVLVVQFWTFATWVIPGSCHTKAQGISWLPHSLSGGNSTDRLADMGIKAKSTGVADR